MRSPLNSGSRLFAALISLWLVTPATTSVALDAAQDTIHDVVVVGAGAAGLAAAHTLVTLGFDVLVLEANNRTGGRVWNTIDVDPDFATYEQALGGSYVQGVENNPFYDDLVARYGADEFERMLTYDNSGAAIFEATWDPDKDIVRYPGRAASPAEVYDYWDFYYHIYDADDHDASISFEQELADHGGISSSDPNYHLHASYGANYQARLGDLAIRDFTRQDISWPYSGGSVQFRTKSWSTALNDEFADELVAGGHIMLNSRVTEINTTGPRPYAVANGNKHYAGAIVVTVSAGVINEGEITFAPPLPAAKLAAYQALNMYKGDGGSAVLLKWDSVNHWRPSDEWYINDGPGGNCWMDALHKDIPANEKVIWKCLIHPDQYVKRGMGTMTDQEVVNLVARDFAQGFSTMKLRNLVDSMLFRTTEHPSFYGSYSSPGFGSFPDTGNKAYEEAALPVGSTLCQKLHFAGEATAVGSALVHSAVETGWRAALEIDAELTPGSCDSIVVPEPSALMQSAAACFVLWALASSKRGRESGPAGTFAAKSYRAGLRDQSLQG